MSISTLSVSSRSSSATTPRSALRTQSTNKRRRRTFISNKKPIYIPGQIGTFGIPTQPPTGWTFVEPTLEDILLDPLTDSTAELAFYGTKSLPLMTYDGILNRDGDRVQQYESFKTQWNALELKATTSNGSSYSSNGLRRVKKVTKNLSNLSQWHGL